MLDNMSAFVRKQLRTRLARNSRPAVSTVTLPPPVFTPLHWAIDVPDGDELVYQHGFDCKGWVYLHGTAIGTIEVSIDDALVGATENLYPRPDVAEVYDRADMLLSGFLVRCNIPEALRSKGQLELRFDLVSTDREKRVAFARRNVRLSKIDYRQHGHGAILTDAASQFLVRNQVYGSGPPSPIADPVCVELVRNYLAAEDDVLDVGCGIGAWCAPLTSRGLHWTGCETREDFVQHMLSENLRAVYVENGKLPFADGAFDATISIEVLEHVADYDAFLSEVSRVSKRGGLFSVPNFAAIPITSSFYALPWHMLESDHKNFFTAQSLETLLRRFYARVETFEYGPLPQLQSSEGIKIKNHIFAIALH